MVKTLRGCRLVAVLLFGFGTGVTAEPGATTNGRMIATGLRDLHYGLYTSARETFLDLTVEAPDEPDSHLFLAYNYWWHLNFDADRYAEIGEPFDAAIEAVVSTAERRLEDEQGDVVAMSAIGTAHILRSHVEARRKHYFRAGGEARRGKKMLVRVLKQDPDHQSAKFALGAFNYYADKVPLIVKGLRFLLFLPGGDSDLGLQQLRDVALSDSPFRTDARLLLSLICGSPQEHSYDSSREHIAVALEENPGSPLIRGLVGEMMTRLGNYQEAARVFRQAIDESSGDSEDNVRQRIVLRIELAEALLADWQLSQARELLEDPGFDQDGIPASSHRKRARLLFELRAKTGVENATDQDDGGKSDFSRLVERSLEELGAGAPDRALASLEAAAGEDPGSVIPVFLRGRLFYQIGMDKEAIDAFEEIASRRDDQPPWIAGWTELYLGLALKRGGDDESARDHFKESSEARRFRSADRAILELESGQPENPSCSSRSGEVGPTPRSSS